MDNETPCCGHSVALWQWTPLRCTELQITCTVSSAFTLDHCSPLPGAAHTPSYWIRTRTGSGLGLDQDQYIGSKMNQEVDIWGVALSVVLQMFDRSFNQPIKISLFKCGLRGEARTSGELCGPSNIFGRWRRVTDLVWRSPGRRSNERVHTCQSGRTR